MGCFVVLMGVQFATNMSQDGDMCQLKANRTDVNMHPGNIRFLICPLEQALEFSIGRLEQALGFSIGRLEQVVDRMVSQFEKKTDLLSVIKGKYQPLGDKLDYRSNKTDAKIDTFTYVVVAGPLFQCALDTYLRRHGAGGNRSRQKETQSKEVATTMEEFT